MNDSQHPPSTGDGSIDQYAPPHSSDQYHDPAASRSNAMEWFDRYCRPVYESRGWLRLLSIAFFIIGVFQVLSVVGILWAWVPIWLGVLLWQAAGSAESAMENRDESELERFLHRLKTVFTVAGVLVIISVLLSIVGTFTMLLFGGLGIISEYLQNL